MNVRIGRNILYYPTYLKWSAIGVDGFVEHIGSTKIFDGSCFGNYYCIDIIESRFRIPKRELMRKDFKKSRVSKQKTRFIKNLIVFF